MNSSETNEVVAIYKQLIQSWNNQDARGMADLYLENGESIGFDGSLAIGSEEIYSHIAPIFKDHRVSDYVYKVKNVQFLSTDIALLRAVAGMIPPGQTELNSKVNTHHTLIIVKKEGQWKIQLFQNTPAQFHGRPELVEQMTNELAEELIKNK